MPVITTGDPQLDRFVELVVTMAPIDKRTDDAGESISEMHATDPRLMEMDEEGRPLGDLLVERYSRNYLIHLTNLYTFHIWGWNVPFIDRNVTLP